MVNRKTLLLPFFILIAINLHAQLTKEDSIWIEKVKSGKIKLKLNPETKKAIEEGALINADKPSAKLRNEASELPLSKEFTDIRPKDEDYEYTDTLSLPPAVWMIRKIPDSSYQRSFVYVAPPKNYITMRKIPIGTNGIYITAETGDLNPFVKDGGTQRGALGTVGYSFSMEDLLRYAFMPSERAKMRNRKKATAWKYY